MFYPKNVPNVERVARIVTGIVLIGVALFSSTLLPDATPLGLGIIVFSAVFVVVTGFVGWCPACALIGRKIKATQRYEQQH